MDNYDIDDINERPYVTDDDLIRWVNMLTGHCPSLKSVFAKDLEILNNNNNDI